MPPNQQNQYDFILSPTAPSNRGPNLGGSMGARIAVVAGGVILLIILIVVAMQFLNSGSKAQTQRLVEIAQTQSEIIRVSAVGEQKGKDLNTRALALNTKFSIESSQLEVKQALKKHGVNDKQLAKTLGALKNKKTDSALDEATRNNRFDETFNALLAKQLGDYQKLLKGASKGANKSEKTVLDNSYSGVGRLFPKKAEAAS